MRTELLSFTLRRAETHQDLLLACQIRAEAYGRKVASARESMAVPDAIDESPWTTVFLCEDKVTGAAVGTARIQTRMDGQGELALERFISLPEEYKRASCAEVTRLAAPVGADPFVRLALWKAAYLFSAASGISWILMTVRKPSLLRAYLAMGAKDIYPNREEGFTLPYVGTLPHRVYGLDIDNFYGFWADTQHPLLEFMTATNHEDIVIAPPLVHRRPVVDVVTVVE